jgi:RNA polymerase sigma factor (sigma-70 family)
LHPLKIFASDSAAGGNCKEDMETHLYSENELLVHAAWVQGMVAAMVRDTHLAEDLVQDALEAGIRAGSGRIRNPRTWLLGVVRNLHRQDARAGLRRRATEERKPAPTEEPSSDDLVARLEVQQLVASAVMNLPDPFRSVLILRFYEGAPIRRIAALRGIEREKAESQVRRGLQLLRGQLQVQLGKAWIVMVLPLAIPLSSVAAATTVGALSLAGAISTQTLLGVAAGVLALAGLSFWALGEASDAAQDLHPNTTEVVADLDGNAHILEEGANAEIEGEVVIERSTIDATAAFEGDWIVRGTLTDCGEPAAFAEAILLIHDGYSYDSPLLHEIPVTSNAQGNIAWGMEAPGRTVLVRLRSADHKRRPGRCYGSFAFPNETPPQDLNLDFYDWSFVVQGVVRDTQGNPLIGAKVQTVEKVGETDQHGHFSLPAASNRKNLYVYAQAPGYAQVQKEIRFGGSSKEMELVLPKEIVVRGRVADEHGIGIPGAEVTHFRLYRQSAITDAQGAYELRNLNAEQYGQTLFAEKAGRVKVQASAGILAAGAEAKLDFVLPQGAILQGRVTDANGKPVDGARVTVGSTLHASMGREAYSDADGLFRIPGIPAGAIDVFVERRQYIPFRAGLEVEFGAGQVLDFPIQLSAGRNIQVSVVGPVGKPMEKAWVNSQYGERPRSTFVKTDATGFVELPSVAAAEVKVFVGKPGFRTATITVSATENQLEVQLAEDSGFRGTVVDAQTGLPVTQFRVRLVFPETRSGETPVNGIPGQLHDGTDFESATGEWGIRADFEPQHWIGIAIVAEGYQHFEDQHVQVPMAGKDFVLNASLKRGTILHGVVLPRDGGAPIAGARLTWVNPEHVRTHGTLDEQSPSAFTDDQGRFSMAGIPSQDASLAVVHPDWTSHLEGPISIGANQSEKEVTIYLDAGVTLSGRILGFNGNPLENVQIMAAPNGLAVLRIQPKTMTDANGRFAFDGLPIGKYWIRAQVANGSTWWTLYEVSGKQLGPEGLDFDIRLDGASCITGRLKSTGELPAVIPVLAQQVSGASGQPYVSFGCLATDGKFELAGIPPGKYHVEIPSVFREDGTYLFAERVAVTVNGKEPANVELEVTVEELNLRR